MKNKILAMIFVCVFFVAINSSFALAAGHGLPPAPPTTGGGGGGGGGGSSGSYNPPVITYPKFADVKDSNSKIIGNVTQASASDISFWIEQQVTVNGQTYTVRIEGKLNSLPTDAKLSIAGVIPDITTLPAAVNANAMLAEIDLSGFSGWDIKAGSLKITLIMPQGMVGSADLSKSLIIWYDGTVYELLYPAGTPAADNGNVTYSVMSPHDAFPYNGDSKYMLVTAGVLPTPTPTIEATATPVPTEESHGPSLVTVLLALMLAAVVAAAFVLYFMMQKKQ